MILDLKTIGVNRFVVGPLGTNCYVIHDKRSMKGAIIDPGDHDPEIAEYIRDNGIEIEYILNTHGHADHIKANAFYGYPVLLHELDEECLSDPTRNLSFLSGAEIEPVSPHKLLKDGDIITLGELKLQVIHTPGHTPGGICIKAEEVLFSGDTLFYEGIGRTDIPGGDHELIIRSIKGRLMTLPGEVKVFPGHGPETTIEHERKNNPFL
jgi:glyoxylase-like metal-dependent hydrolase (beta-lactamase superfamily II)